MSHYSIYHIDTAIIKHEGYFPGGGALHIFWVWGRAIGKGIYFQDIGIKNGINFHNLV